MQTRVYRITHHTCVLFCFFFQAPENWINRRPQIISYARACHFEMGFCVVADNRPAVEPYFLEVGGIYPSQLPAPAVAALEKLTKQARWSRDHTSSCCVADVWLGCKFFYKIRILNLLLGGAWAAPAWPAWGWKYSPISWL